MRDCKKLENQLSIVKGLLNTISFKQEKKHHKYAYGGGYDEIIEQSRGQIKSRIKVARALLIDISKELS